MVDGTILSWHLVADFHSVVGEHDLVLVEVLVLPSEAGRAAREDLPAASNQIVISSWNIMGTHSLYK